MNDDFDETSGPELTADEQARYAARLVKVSYNAEKHVTDTEAVRGRARVPRRAALPKPRGNPEEAMRSAPVKIEAEYRIPIEHHNPMELHAAIAVWQGDKLTIFDKTQEVYNVRKHLASSFGVPEENVNVISPFVGGAFGSSLRPNYYPALTAMAARELKRPVKVVYTRTQMFTGHGYRPYTIQRVALGAERSGKLTAMIHEAVHNTSSFEEFSDDTTRFTRSVYACPNYYAPLKITDTDLATPLWMRAPGAVSGMFALECAMDELAYALKLDPTVAALIALNRPDQLRSHLTRARENGVTQDELIEAITHLAFYAGWPGAMTAISVAKEVFEKK